MSSDSKAEALRTKRYPRWMLDAEALRKLIKEDELKEVLVSLETLCMVVWMHTRSPRKRSSMRPPESPRKSMAPV